LWYVLAVVTARFLKPWPNGVASYRKLKTCINLRVRLAMTCVYLRWLPFTLIELKFARKFFTVWSPNASRSQYCFPLYRCICKAAMKWLSYYFRWTCESVWPPIASLCSQVCVCKLTFPNLCWLATPFGQGLKRPITWGGLVRLAGISAHWKSTSRSHGKISARPAGIALPGSRAAETGRKFTM